MAAIAFNRLNQTASEPASCRPGPPAGAATVRLATPGRFLLRVLGPLLAIGAVAGIIGLKAVIFLSRLNS